MTNCRSDQFVQVVVANRQGMKPKRDCPANWNTGKFCGWHLGLDCALHCYYRYVSSTMQVSCAKEASVDNKRAFRNWRRLLLSPNPDARKSRVRRPVIQLQFLIVLHGVRRVAKLPLAA